MDDHESKSTGQELSPLLWEGSENSLHWEKAGAIMMLTNAWSRILGKASHAFWRCPPFDQPRKGRVQVKPFFIGFMATKRTAISKKTRFEIFKRDGFKCMYCGNHPPQVLLHVDHIDPVSKGGKNDPDNLITACEPCNLGKSATPLSSVPQSLKDKALLTMEREEQIRGFQSVMAGKRLRIEDEAYEVADLFVTHFNEDGIRKDYIVSIKNFIDKLGLDDCLDSMEKAISKKPYSKYTCFAYFCGICWNKIRESDGVTSA